MDKMGKLSANLATLTVTSAANWESARTSPGIAQSSLPVRSLDHAAGRLSPIRGVP